MFFAFVGPVSGEPRVVECSVCFHAWFADESHVLDENEATEDVSAVRVAARRKKRHCAELVPSNPYTIRASNLSSRTTAGILKKVFGAYGRVLRCELIPAVGPHERLSGLVEMANDEQAREAINCLHGKPRLKTFSHYRVVLRLR